MARLRIVFMGTPELASASLEALLREPSFELVAVATQPDRPKGRDLKKLPSPVKEIALQHGLPVLQPTKARDEAFVTELRRLQPDLIAVAAYGQILPESILNVPRFGCLNVHTSLLPKYRGASPIQSAILNGDEMTGVTIMKMDEELDTGGIVFQESTPIHPEDDSQTLHDRLAQMGAQLLVKTIPSFADGTIKPRPQPVEGISFAPKIQKEDGRIVWGQSATAIWNRIRAFTPWPGAFTFLPTQPQPQLLKLWKAAVTESRGQPGEIMQAGKSGVIVACGEDALCVHSLQREGGRRMTAQEFLAGHPLKPGSILQ